MITWKDIKYFFIDFVPNLKRGLEYFALGWKDYDWDYSSMLHIEQKKLNHMIDYFSNHGMTTDSPQVAKELKLLRSLIDIILDGGNTYTIDIDPPMDDTDKTFNARDFMSDYFNRHHIRKLKYVNTKNAARFMNAEELEIFNEDYKRNHLSAAWEEELYLRKAVHLYSKLKNDRMLQWAD